MRVRITDDRIPGEDLVIAVNAPEYMEDPILLTEEEALKVVEFWESSADVGGRGSYDLTEQGMIVLAEVYATGDDIELMAWQDEQDGEWAINDFPSTTLHYRVEGVA